MFRGLKSNLGIKFGSKEQDNICLFGVRIELESLSEEERIQQIAAIFVEAEELSPGFSAMESFVKREISSLDCSEIKRGAAQRAIEAPAAAKHGKEQLANNKPTMRELVGEEEDYFASSHPYRKLTYQNSEVYFVKPFISRYLVVYIKLGQDDLYDYIRIIKTNGYSYNNDPKEITPCDRTKVDGSFKIEAKKHQGQYLSKITSREELLRDELMKVSVPVSVIEKIEQAFMFILPYDL